MIEKKKQFGIIFFNVLFSLSLLPAQSLHELLRKGDRRYDAEQYKAAEKHYRDAADLKYGDPTAAYNLGNSLYQQGNWEDAAARFEQTVRSTPDAALKADALHNLGNTFLKRQKFKEAVEAYENSLRIRPGDSETKRNLQLAKKKLEKEEKERERKDKEQQQKNQDQQKQQPQQQDQNQEQKQQPQQQNQPQQPNQGTPQNEQPTPDNQQPKPNNEQRLKKEEARRLLETFIGQEDQKNARKYRELRQQPKPSGKEKDW